MRQLHVLGVSEDGTTLLLGSTTRSSKASHRIHLDDRLKAAVRGQLSAPGSDRTESALPPKEIQARLRAGATPDEVAKAAGVPVARVLPYFAPVEAERERIIGEARRATVHRHRGPDATTPLGDAVDARLREVAGLKDDSIEWTARRRADGAWVVALSYVARGGRRQAQWLWQPAGRSLTALDAAATRLATDAVPARKRAARKAAPPKPAQSRGTGSRGTSKRRPAAKKATATPAARPRPAAAKARPAAKPARPAAANRPTATKARPPAAKKVAATKPAAAKPVAAKKVTVAKPVAAKKQPAVKKASAAAARKPAPIKKTARPRREKVTTAPRFTLVPPPAEPTPEVLAVQAPPVQVVQTAEPVVVVPVSEPEPAAAAAATAAEPAAAPRRKPGARVPLPSWSEVLLGVGGSTEGSDTSRRGG